MATNVNRPVVKEQKEADVNRKLQIYGIISAFQQGKVPSVGYHFPRIGARVRRGEP
jgi:starvation-inducible outer membrane lipoprotein